MLIFSVFLPCSSVWYARIVFFIVHLQYGRRIVPSCPLCTHPTEEFQQEDAGLLSPSRTTIISCCIKPPPLPLEEEKYDGLGTISRTSDPAFPHRVVGFSMALVTELFLFLSCFRVFRVFRFFSFVTNRRGSSDLIGSSRAGTRRNFREEGTRSSDWWRRRTRN